jgi:hypothetical protein
MIGLLSTPPLAAEVGLVGRNYFFRTEILAALADE